MKRIDTLFAFIAVDEFGDEGVVGATLPGLGFSMLAGADLARIESLRPLAEKIAKATSKEIKLIQLTTRAELGVINQKGEYRANKNL